MRASVLTHPRRVGPSGACCAPGVCSAVVGPRLVLMLFLWHVATVFVAGADLYVTTRGLGRAAPAPDAVGTGRGWGDGGCRRSWGRWRHARDLRGSSVRVGRLRGRGAATSRPGVRCPPSSPGSADGSRPDPGVYGSRALSQRDRVVSGGCGGTTRGRARRSEEPCPGRTPDGRLSAAAGVGSVLRGQCCPELSECPREKAGHVHL